MLKTLGYAALIGGTLIALPAFAQTPNDTFVKEQAINQWRASKLVGVKVVGNDQKKIGSIEDVLLDHDGAAQTVVIGVGGFLGIGAKDVAVPFKTMQWRTEGRAVAVNSAQRVAGRRPDGFPGDGEDRPGGHRGEPGLSGHGDARHDQAAIAERAGLPLRADAGGRQSGLPCARRHGPEGRRRGACSGAGRQRAEAVSANEGVFVRRPTLPRCREVFGEAVLAQCAPPERRLSCVCRARGASGLLAIASLPGDAPPIALRRLLACKTSGVETFAAPRP